MDKKLTFDALLGDPTLPDVSDATFTPAKVSTFLGLLVDFGYVSAEDAQTALDEVGENALIDSQEQPSALEL